MVIAAIVIVIISKGIPNKPIIPNIKKGLDSEFKRKKEYLADGMYDEERDFMIFLLDDKVRIPYALSFDWDDMDEAPDLSHRQAGVARFIQKKCS